MRKFHRYLTVFLLLACSCKNFSANFTEIKNFSAAVKALYPESRMTCGIKNGNIVDVTFINTPYNDSSDEVKQNIATRIGKIARQYFKTSKIERGEVIFEKKVDGGIVNVSSTHSYDMEIK